MRLLFVIICSVFLSVGSASADVCMTVIEGGNRMSPFSLFQDACSAETGFKKALSVFLGSDDFVSFSSVYWAPYRLVASDTGHPMVQQNIVARISSTEDVTKIRQERERFFTRMSQFEAEIKPYLCQHRDTEAFTNAGGVAEFNLRVAARGLSSPLFDGAIATVYLNKESCEGV